MQNQRQSPRQAQSVEQEVDLVVRTAVVVDERPLVREGLRCILTADEHLAVIGESGIDGAVAVLGARTPELAIVVVRENDPDPFRLVATSKALQDDLHVLVLADVASVIDLREAVIAGVDSFLLTTATAPDIRDAARATARGERVVSPEVAMQLAGNWRREGERAQASSLTPRELEVLQLLAEGMTNQEVGSSLGLSARTIKTHVQNLLSKLDVPDRTGAVARGFRLGLIR